MMSVVYTAKECLEHPTVDQRNSHLHALPRLYSPVYSPVRIPSDTQSSTTQTGNYSISLEKPSIHGSPSANLAVPKLGRLGICAMDEKVLSKANQEIFRRLQGNGDLEIVYFGDQTLVQRPVDEWPTCDFLIAFYSDNFPLDKAISYVESRLPICYNDLLMQKLLLDRRLCHRILQFLGLRTPKRLEVNRDGGARAYDWKIFKHVYDVLGLRLPGPSGHDNGDQIPYHSNVSLSEDGNTLFVDGQKLHKPFVEKPASAEDHNVYIYFPSTAQSDGGGRRLFRKVGNKCSEYDPSLVTPRCIMEQDNSYVYEPLLNADGGEDVKAYAVGRTYCLAVTRKSPVLSDVVVREADGREKRQATTLSREETEAATKIALTFGQAVCGFDIVRNKGKSYVIDVNGWTSVKNQPAFYDRCACILRQMLTSRLESSNRNAASTNGD